MKKLLILCLFLLGQITVHAEIRIIGVRVTRDAESKVYVSISSEVDTENKKDITVKQASDILRDAKGRGSSVMLGIVAHDVPLQDYLPLLKVISENAWLNLAFIEGQKPDPINDNIKKSIEQDASGNRR